MKIEILDLGSNTLTKHQVEYLANDFTVTFGEACKTIRFKSGVKYFEYIDCSVQQIFRDGWVNVLLLNISTTEGDKHIHLHIHIPDLHMLSDIIIHQHKHSYEIRVYTPEVDVYDVHSLPITTID